jgi:hypothetical protein
MAAGYIPLSTGNGANSNSLFATPTPTVASNGASNGIVWAVDTEDAGTGNASLHVKLNGTSGHAIPTVANGMVCIGTEDCLAAYGEYTGLFLS